MTVERQGYTYCVIVHYDKRNAIGERVRFVRALLKILPAPVKDVFSYIDEFDAGTFQEHSANLHCFFMSVPAVEEGDDFVKNKGCCDQ